MRKISFVAAAAIVLTLLSFATDAGYKAEDRVDDFSVKNTMDDQMVSLSTLKGATNGAIVVFTCNHCPFAKKYESRIMDLDKQYAAKGFPVLAISSNDPAIEPEDAPDRMGDIARERQYTFPYAYDETQNVARTFGATKTPHVYVLSLKDKSWIVKYIGAIDDNCNEPSKVTKRYVNEAVDALLMGRDVPVKETKAIGCSIKWKR